MAYSRLRCLIISFVSIILLLLVIGTLFYLIRRNDRRITEIDTCPRPKQYSTDYDFDFTKSPREYQNLNSSVDFFVLSLSWSPGFCHGKSHAQNLFQCQHKFDFIVHGLWPNTIKPSENNLTRSHRIHPRNCRNEEQIPMDIIKKYFCMIPSENLMQAEWEKHGTCYWEKPDDYFQQIYSLYKNIKLPNDIHDILNNQTITRRARKESIKQSFINNNPQIKSDEINVFMTGKNKQLKEIYICYDRQFNHITCN